MSTERPSCVVTAEFVDRWEQSYDERKYPVDSYLHHSARARSAKSPDELKEALLALLHWKDGKAGSFVPGEAHAKPNTLRPIASLTGIALAEFANSFRALVVADKSHFRERESELRTVVGGLWKSGKRFVIPAFLLHIARPDRLPMIDQHTLRAYLWLTSQQFVEKPTITWELWSDYVVFFQDALVAAGFDSDLESRCRMDRALFAYGKWLKEAYPREKEKMLRERVQRCGAG